MYIHTYIIHTYTFIHKYRHNIKIRFQCNRGLDQLWHNNFNYLLLHQLWVPLQQLNLRVLKTEVGILIELHSGVAIMLTTVVVVLVITDVTVTLSGVLYINEL